MNFVQTLPNLCVSDSTLKLAEEEEAYMLRLLGCYQKILYEIHQAKQRVEDANEGIAKLKSEMRAPGVPGSTLGGKGGSKGKKGVLQHAVKKEK